MILSGVINNTSCYEPKNEELLREVTVQIGLKRIDT